MCVNIEEPQITDRTKFTRLLLYAETFDRPFFNVVCDSQHKREKENTSITSTE